MYRIHNHVTRLIALLVTLSCLTLSQTSAHAQGSTQVRITPAEIQIPAGHVAQAAVEVDDVQALYGVDIALKFDPDAVEVVGVDANQGPAKAASGTFLDAGFVAINQVDNTAGTVRFVMTQINPSEPKSGSGILIVLNLRGKRDGATSPLTLVKVDMAQRNGKIFSAALVPGLVRGAPASQAVPAATPFPTQGGAMAMPGAAAPGATVAVTAVRSTVVSVAAAQIPAATGAAISTPVEQPSVANQSGAGVSNPTDQTELFLGAGGMVTIVVVAMAIFSNRKRHVDTSSQRKGRNS